MIERTAIRQEAERLIGHFTSAGAERVEAAVLQPADTLLDLYGEDIRARAYVTADPVLGERVLRPDFTVPVVLHHLDEQQNTARYAYSGLVFRRQETSNDNRPSEYLQVGLELFGGQDPVSDEAEVFATIAKILSPLRLNAAFGDMGLLRAAVQGLAMSDQRRTALMRHLWRPQRFKLLLDRFANPVPTRNDTTQNLEQAGPQIGLRTRAEVLDRLDSMAAEASSPPLKGSDVTLLEDLLALSGTPGFALARLRDLAVDLPALMPAVDRFEARIAALEAHGIATESLEFEASYGRTTLEYYDGFVFGFYAPNQLALPPIATGGRYDALVHALGGDCSAVGGVIRPELTLRAGELT